MADKRSLTLEDFWRLDTASDVQLSPDGKTAAYVVGGYDESKNTANSAIWLVDIETGLTRQFSSGETQDMQPRWAPDGSRIAFVSTRHDGKPQIFLIPLEGGEPRRLTSDEMGAQSPLWSPDGRQLCYSSVRSIDTQTVPQEVAWFKEHQDADQNAPRMRRQATLLSRMDGRGYVENRSHLFLIEVDSDASEPKQLTNGDQDEIQPAWSPDGTLIAFISNRCENAEFRITSDVYVISPQGGEPTRLTNEDLMALSPVWSPDSRSIAVYASPDWTVNGYRDSHLWTVSREGGDQREVTAGFDQACGGGVQPDYMWPGPTAPAFSADSGTIYFIAVDHGDEAIFAIPRDGGTVRRVSQNHGCAGGLQCTPDGRLIVCLAATPTHPYDVFAVPADGGELRPVTNTNRRLLEEAVLVEPEHLNWTGPDGWEIEGWLIKPVDAANKAPYPLILHVHGGPYGSWGNSFYFQAQALAGAGYASLYANPRGSNGYGEAFAMAADWGEKDFEDLMAGVDTALAGGQVDGSRLGITGISYGGFMTNWAIGHTDRFAAAVSVNGVSSNFSMYGVSDISAIWLPTEFGGSFWENEEAWQRYRFHSPITYVADMDTPLLLIQAENDYRCPIVEGEQLLTALRVRRQTVELIRMPGPSHVIVISGTPHQRYFQWRLTKDWFDKYAMRLAEPDEVAAAVATPEAVTPPLSTA